MESVVTCENQPKKKKKREAQKRFEKDGRSTHTETQLFRNTKTKKKC